MPEGWCEPKEPKTARRGAPVPKNPVTKREEPRKFYSPRFGALYFLGDDVETREMRVLKMRSGAQNPGTLGSGGLGAIPSINGCGLVNSLHGSGQTILIPGFDCDSNGIRTPFWCLQKGVQKNTVKELRVAFWATPPARKRHHFFLQCPNCFFILMQDDTIEPIAFLAAVSHCKFTEGGKIGKPPPILKNSPS